MANYLTSGVEEYQVKEVKYPEKFVQRVLSIIQGSADLSRFYEQLTQSEKAIERREV